MRILVLADGSLGHTSRWVGFFKERGHEVLLLSFEKVDAIGASTQRIRTALPTKLLGYLCALPIVRKRTKIFRPDIVSALYLGGYGLVASLCGSRPLATVSLGSDLLLDYACSPLHRWQIRRAIRASDLVIVDADVCARIVEAEGARNVIKVYMGIDERVFHRIGARETKPAKPRIVSTRNLYPVYDVSSLLEAAAKLEEARNADFVICGDGPERKRLEKRAKELGLADRFTFAGRLEPAKLAELLRTATIYVSTSLSDSTSVSLLEAMACGAFPVVTDLPANREWITHESNGLVIPLRNPQKLAEAIHRALCDEELRLRAAERNDRIIHERGLFKDNMMRVEDAFEKIVAAKKKLHSPL